VQEQPALSQLVVIGSSAGGIEALSVLLSALPAEFPAPVVIAQHLDPGRESHLQEILSRRSPLPVRTVLEHEPLESGVVYVVPADRNVEITDHEVRLPLNGGTRPKPSVDLLLGSAARVFGEDLYAVILSGTGSDGADGARLVKEAGGTVIIQDPQTATYPGMPLSLAPTSVDIIADLEAIGPLLYELLTGAYTPPAPETDRQMRSLLERLRVESGIDFSRYRAPTIQRRLQRRMADTGRDTLDEYLRYAQRHPDELRRLTDSFLIRVTGFFRDADLFDLLRDRLLPELIADARGRDNELRVWSAGCSTGEEAYSLAILLAEALGDEIDDFHLRVFATDVNPAAVDFARRGVYTASSLASLRPTLLQRYFSPLDGAYEVRKLVRRHVVFGQHDLAQRSPFPRLDLLLCRNVLIYFTPELQQRVLQLFAFALRTGGRLILGKSESTGAVADHFVLEEPRLKVYRRQGERLLFAPAQLRNTVPLPRPPTAPRPPLSRPNLAVAGAPLPPLTPRPPGESTERYGGELPVGTVVVDRRYDVHVINTVARRLLGIHASAIGEDFIHLTRRVDSERLRTAIDRAFGGERAIDQLEIKALDLPPGALRYLEISCFPQQLQSRGERVDRVVVIVAEVPAEPSAPPPTQAVAARRQEELARAAGHLQAAVGAATQTPELGAVLAEAGVALDTARTEIERLALLVAEVDADRQELLAANQALAAANADLRTQNEDLLVAHEEAQAAVEEIETLNEEQQATNEELETLNEELQATIEELNTTNDDLESRGLQLQDTTIALEAERSRLAAILASMADAVLVVDGRGETMLTNAAYERLLGSPGAEPALGDEEGRPLPTDATPRRRAARGEAFEMPFTVVTVDGTRRWFEARGQPIRADGHEGGVVVIRDISERSFLRQQTAFVSLVGHELRTPLSAISGSLQLLLRLPPGPDEDPRLRQYADASLRQTRRLAEMVSDLTDVVRLQEGRFHVKLEPLDLAPLVAETVELMQTQAESQTIRLDASASSLPVHGDPRRLQQVLFNLLGNAVLHAPDSQLVDVRLRRVDDRAELQVQDYGPGIPPTEHETIFSRFHQLDDQGTSGRTGLGLGLFITREIVAAHGGTIAVDSREGGGATFTVWLPLRAETS
jgi:two-component system CheB/CheR fusion protein